jgi:hypothetical protein
MVSKALVEITGGKALAKPAPPKTALAVINETLSNVADALAVADRCQSEGINGQNNLGQHAHNFEPARYLAPAKRLLNKMLPIYARAQEASSVLGRVAAGTSDHKITQATAVTMLSALFGALNKKKVEGDDHAGLLLVCADLFSPINRTIGKASGLWKPVSREPVVLALAIKRLLATQVFTPSPSELRETMEFVRRRLEVIAWWTWECLCHIELADEIVFEADRAAWDAVYAKLPRSIVAAMLASEGICNSPDGEDDDGNPIPGSPRWEALNDHHNRLLAAEEARIAACGASGPMASVKAKSNKGTEGR